MHLRDHIGPLWQPGGCLALALVRVKPLEEGRPAAQARGTLPAPSDTHHFSLE